MPLLAGMAPFVWFHCPGDKYAVRSILMGVKNDCVINYNILITSMFMKCPFLYTLLESWQWQQGLMPAPWKLLLKCFVTYITIYEVPTQHSRLLLGWWTNFTLFKLVLLSIWICNINFCYKLCPDHRVTCYILILYSNKGCLVDPIGLTMKHMSTQRAIIMLSTLWNKLGYVLVSSSKWAFLCLAVSDF